MGRTPVFSSPIAVKAPTERSSEPEDAQPGHSLSKDEAYFSANRKVIFIYFYTQKTDSATVAITVLPLAVLVIWTFCPQYPSPYIRLSRATTLDESLLYMQQAPAFPP